MYGQQKVRQNYTSKDECVCKLSLAIVVKVKSDIDYGRWDKLDVGVTRECYLYDGGVCSV